MQLRGLERVPTADPLTVSDPLLDVTRCARLARDRVGCCPPGSILLAA
jgi:hypothetical protein